MGFYKVTWIGDYCDLNTTVHADVEAMDEEYIISVSRDLLIDYHGIDPYVSGLYAEEIEDLSHVY